MLKKKEKKSKNPDVILEEKHVTGKILENGAPQIKDLVSPPCFDRSQSDHIGVANKLARSFIVAGYPKTLGVGWADSLYNSESDLDLMMHITPTDERIALDELTNKITQFQAQLETEREKGSNRNITKLQAQINDLVEERAKVEQNYISLFRVQMIMSLYADTVDQLNKESQLMDAGMKGRKVKLMPLYLQQDQGYKSTLPFGKSWLPKIYRNFSSEALSACFPFYNAEISHKNGVLVGVNLQTATPIYIDFYDRELLNNSNMTIFGQAGSGKTFLVSLLTMRSVLAGIRTVIIDAEGEYKAVTEAMGGTIITIAPGSSTVPNPFDVEDEDEVDKDDKPTGKHVVLLKDKVADLLNLIGVMVGSLTQEQKSLISYAITAVYEQFGITEDPASLYEQEAFLDENGEFTHHGAKRRMPQISDLIRELDDITQKESNQCLISVTNALRMYAKDGVYGMFDTQTSSSLANFKDAPVVSFDVSQLEEGTLRPIGMYVALSWTWEKFAKRNVRIKKRILCDEAWMMMNKNMAGHEYTATFLENVSRRIRKRNGGLCVASQNFKEFADNPQGQAVLTNAMVKIFLHQSTTDIDDVQNIFKLSDGERSFLLTAKRGHFLLKANNESTVGYAMPTSYEKALVEKHTVANLAKK